jgi:excisionase family DNA binding protein
MRADRFPSSTMSLQKASGPYMHEKDDYPAYRSAEKDGQWLTMSEAAAKLGVTHHRIRRLIKDGMLAAEQVVPGAPFQIRASDLEHERVVAAIARTGLPCRADADDQIPMFSTT